MPDKQTYADRYPEVADRLLWCVGCGDDAKATDLDYYQLCPKCVALSAKHAPPFEEAPAIEKRQ